MTVKELIEKLQRMDQDAVVNFDATNEWYEITDVVEWPDPFGVPNVLLTYNT